MSRATAVAAFTVFLALTGCETVPGKGHECAACKSYREKAQNPKDTSDWQRHKCECANCADCKAGSECKTCKM